MTIFKLLKKINAPESPVKLNISNDFGQEMGFEVRVDQTSIKNVADLDAMIAALSEIRDGVGGIDEEAPAPVVKTKPKSRAKKKIEIPLMEGVDTDMLAKVRSKVPSVTKQLEAASDADFEKMMGEWDL